MLSMMITLCSASPVWATEAAPAAAAAENLAETGNGKTEEIKPAETNLSEAKPEDANPPGEKPGETAPPAENRLRRKKEKSPSGSGESEGSGKLTVDGYEVYAALSGNTPSTRYERVRTSSWWSASGRKGLRRRKREKRDYSFQAVGQLQKCRGSQSKGHLEAG